MRHCLVEIPFCTFVEVKGAQKGDRCQVEVAEVEAQVEEEVRGGKKRRCDDDDDDHKQHKDNHNGHGNCFLDGLIERLIEKDVIRIVVKVVREKQILVAAEECPPPRDC